MPVPTARTPQEEKVVADIAQHGWHCVFVRSDGDGDPVLQATLGYTVGLWDTYDHPELVIVGAFPDAHARLTELVAGIELGHHHRAGGSEGDVTFAPIAVHRRYALLRLAHWAAGSEPFEALQVVLPEVEGVMQPRLA